MNGLVGGNLVCFIFSPVFTLIACFAFDVCVYFYGTHRYHLLLQLAAGLCCGLSCLAAGGTIGLIGDAGVRGFGLKAENGRKWFWNADEGMAAVIDDATGVS